MDILTQTIPLDLMLWLHRFVITQAQLRSTFPQLYAYTRPDHASTSTFNKVQYDNAVLKSSSVENKEAHS